jgi:hypothetical protein
MGTLGTIFLVIGGFCLFLLFIVVCLFVGAGALRVLNNKKALSKVDITDGFDAEEIAIIKEAFFEKKKAAKASQLKADVIEAMKDK